jgi:hypothetical protein
VKDIDAIDSAPADADSDVEGDLLADAMMGLSVVGAKKCTICQTECVLNHLKRPDLVTKFQQKDRLRRKRSRALRSV